MLTRNSSSDMPTKIPVWGDTEAISEPLWGETDSAAPSWDETEELEPLPNLVLGQPAAPVAEVDSMRPVMAGEPVDLGPQRQFTPEFAEDQPLVINPNVGRVPTGEMSTTYGGPRKPVAGLAETLSSARQETEGFGPWVEPMRPRLEIPGVEVPPESSFGKAAALELVNVAKSVPEFFTSPVGIAALFGSKIAPKLVSAGFSVDLLRSGLMQAKQANENWDQMTDAEKGVAVVDTTSALLFSGMAGAHALKPKPVPPVQGPIATGEVLRMPRPAVPVRTPIQLPDAARIEPPPGVVVETPPTARPGEALPATAAKTLQPDTEMLAELKVKFDGTQPGAATGVPTPEQLAKMSPGERQMYADIAKQQGEQWAFTPQPGSEIPGRTFYVKAGATTEEIRAAYQAKVEQEKKAAPTVAPKVEAAAQTPATRFTVQSENGKLFISDSQNPRVQVGNSVKDTKANRTRLQKIVDDIHAGRRPTPELPKVITPKPAAPALQPKAEPPAQPTPAVAKVEAEGKKVAADIKPAALEFRKLVMEYGEQHGWIKRHDFISPEAEGYRRVSHDTEVSAAYKRALKSLGITAEKNSYNAHAAALPKLKEYLAAHEKLVPIPLEQLPDGTEFTILGEKYTVKGTNPDTGVVTIEDGRTLRVDENAMVKVDPGSIKAKEVSAEFLPTESTPKKPTLAPGVSQGDLIASTQVEDFALVGEKARDAGRISAEKAAAEKTKAEADALAAKQQQDLFSEPKPAAPGETGTVAMRPGPGAASPSEFAQRQATANRKPPPPNPPVTTEPGELPTPEIVRKNRDYHLFNRVNSPQWLFYFGRLGQAAKAAWETMVLGEFNMRESALRDVKDIVIEPLKALPRKLRRKGGQVLFDALNGKAMDQITAEWEKHPNGKLIIAQAEKIKTRLEEIRTTIRDIKRESFRKYLGGLSEDTLLDLYEKNMGVEGRGRTKEEMSDALVMDQFRDDWGIADGSYLPHLFFGQWKVTARLPGSDTVSFVTRSQTIQEAKARIYEQVKANPELARAQFSIAQDYQIPADMIRIGDRQFWKLVGDMKRQNLEPDLIKMALQGKIGRKASKQKWWGSLVRREGAPGYSRDYARVMTAYLNGFHRWRVLSEVQRNVQPLIERTRSEGRINAADRLENLMDNLWGKPTAATKQFDVFISQVPVLRDWIKPMALDRWARSATQIAGMLTLRTVRFAIINRLQPLLGLYPLIGARGIVRAKLLQHSDSGRRLLDEAGVTLDPGQYASELSGRSARRSMVERFSGERSNQELAFLGMYEHGRSLGLDHAQAIEYGKLRGQLMTQFTPLIVDTPQLFEGPLGRVLFQFKRFPVKQVELISQMVADRNVPAIVRLLASFATIGGLSFFIRQTWMTNPDERLRLKRSLDQSLGQKGADTLMYGLPGFLGADISGSIVLGDEPFGRGFYEKAARQLAGPAVSLSVEAARTLSTPKREQTTIGQDAEAILRRFPTTRPLAELSALWNQDYDLRTPDGETKLRRKLTDVLMGLGSFRSANEANIGLAVNGIMALAKRESELKNKWYVATDKRAVQEEINAFNKLWPEAAITGSNLTSYSKYRDRSKDQTDATRIARKQYQKLLPTDQRSGIRNGTDIQSSRLPLQLNSD